MFIDLQNCEQWGSHAGKDDSESSEAPSPIYVQQEPFGSLGTGESSDHVWRGSESKREATVSEIGNISCYYADRVDETGSSDRVENLVAPGVSDEPEQQLNSRYSLPEQHRMWQGSERLPSISCRLW